MKPEINKKSNAKVAEVAKKIVDFETDKKITWCGNCGNYGIVNALMRAIALEGLEREDFMLCYDVGCNGNEADKIEANTIHGLHGRVLSLAAGCKLANPKMKVIASAGDGATFSEGVNHFVHAVRNNYPMLFILHDNENYALTTGQASALTRCGVRLNGTPDGVSVPPLNACDFALSLNPSWVARSFSGEVEHMTEMIRQGLNHDGFAFLQIFQSCPTYNRETPDHWYNERIRDVKELKDYDRHDIWQARKIVQDLEEDIYVGLIYEDKERKSFLETLPNRKGRKTALTQEVEHYDIGGILKGLG